MFQGQAAKAGARLQAHQLVFFEVFRPEVLSVRQVVHYLLILTEDSALKVPRHKAIQSLSKIKQSHTCFIILQRQVFEQLNQFLFYLQTQLIFVFVW